MRPPMSVSHPATLLPKSNELHSPRTVPALAAMIVRIWVMTVGGYISGQMSADLTILAQSLHMPKQTLVARMYGAMLNAHAAVIDTYDKVNAKRMLR